MHYSPVLSAGGMLALGQVLPSGNPAMDTARLLLDLAGLVFLLLVLALLVLNGFSTARHTGRAVVEGALGGTARHAAHHGYGR